MSYIDYFPRVFAFLLCATLLLLSPLVNNASATLTCTVPGTGGFVYSYSCPAASSCPASCSTEAVSAVDSQGAVYTAGSAPAFICINPASFTSYTSFAGCNTESLVISIDGQSSSSISVAADTTHTYQVTGGTSSNPVSIIYATAPGGAGGFSCGTCTGFFNTGGTFATSDLLTTGSSPNVFYLGAEDTLTGVQSNWIQVTINPASSGGGNGTPLNGNGLVGIVCSVYVAVSTAIFILSITLMILGGAIYAGSHVMPGAARGVMQGYGMGMILGGIIGAIIAIMAPYILYIITANPNVGGVCYL